MNKNTKKTPVLKKVKQPKKHLSFTDETWYQSAHKAMSIGNHRNGDVRMPPNFIPTKK